MSQGPFLAYRTSHRGADGGDTAETECRDQLVRVLTHLLHGVWTGSDGAAPDPAVVERDDAVRMTEECGGLGPRTGIVTQARDQNDRRPLRPTALLYKETAATGGDKLGH